MFLHKVIFRFSIQAFPVAILLSAIWYVLPTVHYSLNLLLILFFY